MKKILWIIAALLVFGCGNPDRQYVYLKPRISVIDSRSGSPVLQNDTVKYSNLSLHIDIPYEIYSSIRSSSVLVTSAYAGDILNTYHPTETIKNIKLICLYNYNSQHISGSDIIDSSSLNGLQSKQSIIDTMNSKTEYDGGIFSKLDIKIKNPPSATGIQQFAIVIETSSFSVISDTTIAFTIQP